MPGNSFEESPLGQLLALEAQAGLKPESVHTPPPVPHYWGHRRRLRERFRQGGANALPDYEIMELILFRAIPRRDVKPLAKAIVERFGSFAEAAFAGSARLAEIEGVTDAVITEIEIVREAALRLAKGQVMKKPLFSSFQQIVDYCRSAMAYESREEFRVLYVDSKNRLISDEVHGRGTVNHTPVYVREVIKRSLEVGAMALIVVHNHPSGDPMPSQADIEMTKQLIQAAAIMGVTIHDHIIIGKHGHLSLRAGFPDMFAPVKGDQAKAKPKPSRS